MKKRLQMAKIYRCVVKSKDGSCKIEKLHRKCKKMQNYYTCIQLFSCTNKKYRL